MHNICVVVKYPRLPCCVYLPCFFFIFCECFLTLHTPLYTQHTPTLLHVLSHATTEATTKPLIVDTGEERAQLYKLAARCGASPDAVARAVVDCGGDLDTVASLLLVQQQPACPPWAPAPLERTISPSMLTSEPSSFAFSSLQEGSLSPQSGLYSPTAAQPHSPRAMQPPSPGTPHSPTAAMMHHALFAPPSPPAQAQAQAASWAAADAPWGGAASNPWGGAASQLQLGGLWGPPMGGARDIPPPPPPRVSDHDGVPKAALMAAAQVGLEGFEDADLHTMMAALMCG